MRKAILVELLNNFQETIEELKKIEKESNHDKTTFATKYYNTALQAYLDLIPILKNYVETPTKLVGLAAERD